MRAPSMFSHPSAFLPLLMSAAALACVLGFVAAFGTAPRPDEGALAHLWQLLMAAQLPLIVFFVARWVRRSPREGLPIVALQLAAAGAALLPVWLMGW